LQESGAALVRKYASLRDELFTEAGYRQYAEDLLERITNPYLADTTTRASRDVVRKLGIADRIFGTMTLALEHGIEPKNMAMGAMAGIALLLANAGEYGLPQELRASDWRRIDIRGLTQLLAWVSQSPALPCLDRLADCTCAAHRPLADLLGP
jgi:mannitol-1-phosphate/altronate dehydrogenase